MEHASTREPAGDAPRAPAPGGNAAKGASNGAAAQRFSLERLTSAFARLMGVPAAASAAMGAIPQVAIADDTLADDANLPVTPRMIVEGMLFVGDAAGESISSRQMASHMRDVTAEEVDTIVGQLNEGYRKDGAAYEIVEHAGGYRLQLRADLARLRERFGSRVRAARLTPRALEVLAVVAYRQGVTVDELNRLRASQSYPILSQLVRRQLVRVERPAETPRVARYYTTSRFNQVFGLASPADLPRGDDLTDS